ncbi:MAG TPA: hypothetical protein PKA27_06975 [Fimbriimonadaceae bacterium]|nr:hypothetical protein [Fimbriimonadaceae bacterium]
MRTCILLDLESLARNLHGSSLVSLLELITIKAFQGNPVQASVALSHVMSGFLSIVTISTPPDDALTEEECKEAQAKIQEILNELALEGQSEEDREVIKARMALVKAEFERSRKPQ